MKSMTLWISALYLYALIIILLFAFFKKTYGWRRYESIDKSSRPSSLKGAIRFLRSIKLFSETKKEISFCNWGRFTLLLDIWKGCEALIIVDNFDIFKSVNGHILFKLWIPNGIFNQNACSHFNLSCWTIRNKEMWCWFIDSCYVIHQISSD